MYLIFGVATTVVSWIVYGVAIHAIISSGGFGPLWKLSAETVNIDVANIISWIISVTFAFITNKLWVFESKSWEHAVVWKEAWTFYGGRVFTGVLELVLMPLLMGGLLYAAGAAGTLSTALSGPLGIGIADGGPCDWPFAR